MKALISGFEPFGGETVNPAWQAIERLPEIIDDCQVIKLEVPTAFDQSIEILMETIESEEPDFVICVGQAGGRCNITPEVVAINKDDARIADNAGNQPSDRKIKADGENAYFSTLPNKAIIKALHDAEIPAQLSYTAGTFVCNHLFYGLMYAIDKHHPQMRGGFVHVPFSNKQALSKANTAFMNIDTISKALEIAIRTTLQNKVDIHAVGGALD